MESLSSGVLAPVAMTTITVVAPAAALVPMRLLRRRSTTALHIVVATMTVAVVPILRSGVVLRRRAVPVLSILISRLRGVVVLIARVALPRSVLVACIRRRIVRVAIVVAPNARTRISRVLRALVAVAVIAPLESAAVVGR